jgi:hypothetical protein
MRPQDWFSVGVRLMGVYVFYRSFNYWLILLADFLATDISKEFQEPQSPISDILILSVGYLVLAYVLVFGAERLTRWAFNGPPD